MPTNADHMANKKSIRFVDTTIRDGQQSLWGLGMSAGMMMPIADRLDAAGFDAIELITGASFKKLVTELKENPWDLIREVGRRMPKTPKRVIASRINLFEFDPPQMYPLFLRCIAAADIQQVRISDPWNDFEGWKRRVKVANDVRLQPIVNLIYSFSPRHTDEYYAERTRQAATLDVFRLCFKDPGGLLTPERTARLSRIMLDNANGIPLEFHTHCTTGLGPLCALEAIKAGIEIVNTAIPPLADGPSNPSLFNVAANARALGYETDIDEDVLQPVTPHFTEIARREGFEIGRPAEYDYAQYQHQVPGGMISNLAHQLRLVGLENKVEEALEETSRVRAELAYPVMVTPLSQFVGSQAAINVILGERYKEVTDQIIHYALGRYGQEAVAEMDQNVRAKILDRPRAKELAGWELPDPSIEEMRRKLGGPGLSDEDLLLRWLFNEQDLEAMHAAGPPREYETASHPLVGLISDLAGRQSCSHIVMEKPGFSLTMEKTGTA